MNCKDCLNKLDAYLERKLPPEKHEGIEAHLRECKSCSEDLRLLHLAGRIIENEKEMVSNPFLQTRIMARIESLENKVPAGVPAFARILRPVLITTAIAAAVLYGITIGNLFRPVQDQSKVPVELALIDDAALESVNMLSNE